MPLPDGSNEFDVATTVHARADGTTFDTSIDAGFTVGGKANGGYLLALAGRAAGEALTAAGSAHRDPLAATVHFVGTPDAGPAEIEVVVLRVGRGASQVRVSLQQQGRPCVEAAFTMGVLAEHHAGPWWSGLPPRPVAPREACTRLPARRDGAPFEVAIMDRADVRLDPACLGFTAGEPSGRAALEGWISFPGDEAITPLALLFFLDALPPATFDLAATGRVPTLSLTAYVRARPVPGPLVVSQRAHVVDHGRVDEVCELWDASGRLVAQATQLAAIRIPEGIHPPSATG
jgi:hypothetical protein